MSARPCPNKRLFPNISIEIPIEILIENLAA